MSMSRRRAVKLIAGAIPAAAGVRSGWSAVPQAIRPASAMPEVTKFVFDGVWSELKISMKELGLEAPADLSEYSHLVVEMRKSTPQRMILGVYAREGIRCMRMIAYGQNVWLRASIPLRYFAAPEMTGSSLNGTSNRKENSCWFTVSGPFGSIHAVNAISFGMEYALNKPTIELRNVHLSKTDEGSDFLEQGPMLDSFGQWARADWPRKIRSQKQLDQELAAEEPSLAKPADYGYARYGGYRSTQVKATGFFRVEEVDGRWWFVDPDGYLFLSQGMNATPGGGVGFGTFAAGTAQTNQQPDEKELVRTNRRLEAWGMNTGGRQRPQTVMLRWPSVVNFLGLPDVYSPEYAATIDAAAEAQCVPRKNDPLVIGYFIGNEPPWDGKESGICDLILNHPDSVAKTKLKEFLAQGDTPQRRREFVLDMYRKFLEIMCGAVRKHDPNHLVIGIRFSEHTNTDEYLMAAQIFDVCSINIYAYEPTQQVTRTARLSGRPILLSEFHIGVPANGLAAGLMQAMDQTQRGIAYRYYVEQAAALPPFVGSHYFEWQDQTPVGNHAGENYNIGFVDVTNRPYAELVEAAKITNKRLMDLHMGKLEPFTQRPLASEAGAPSYTGGTAAGAMA